VLTSQFGIVTRELLSVMPMSKRGVGSKRYTSRSLNRISNIAKTKKKLKKKTRPQELARYPINGVGAVSGKAFGDAGPARILEGLNATVPRHLTLPVNVGPYTVLRTTTVVEFDGRVAGFGFFRGTDMYVDQNFDDLGNTITGAGFAQGWLPICGFRSGGATSPHENTNFTGIPQLQSLGSSATIAPAAMTVQFMNPGSLGHNETNGILYIGASKTQFRLQDSTTTWDHIGQDFVSFQTPRLCAASKLALRGVQVNAIPVNVQELMDFDRIVPSTLPGHNPPAPTYGDTTVPWRESMGAADASVTLQTKSMKGFAPIMVYNPNNVKMQALVTCEWRVRFDYGHPAASTHTCHAASSTQKWDAVQRITHALGHGCSDIVEHVAALGSQHVKGLVTQAMEGLV